MNIKSHVGRVAFSLFHYFIPLKKHESKMVMATHGAKDPVPIKLAKTSWIYLGLSLRDLFFISVNRSIFTVSLCYLLFNNFTFLKNQYTMVEYKGVLDVISKTFRSGGTW